MSKTSNDTSLEGPGLNPPPETWDMLRKLTGVVEPEAQLRGFCLHLGDGSRWWLGGFEPVMAWADQLATLMQLQPGAPGDASLIILFGNKDGIGWAASPPVENQTWFHIKRKHWQAWYRPGFPDVLWEFNFRNRFLVHPFLLYASAFIYRESIHRGSLPFHAALVEREGQGVILAAPGGTGKSSCYRRLPSPWQGRCDDEGLLALVPEGHYLAHPFPTWSDCILSRRDKTWKVQDPVPLVGVFFLEQSSFDDCAPLGPAEAAVAATASALQVMARLLLVCGTGEAQALRRAMFTNACELVKKVPAFRLQVSLTGRFWEKIEAALGWR